MRIRAALSWTNPWLLQTRASTLRMHTSSAKLAAESDLVTPRARLTVLEKDLAHERAALTELRRELQKATRPQPPLRQPATGKPSGKSEEWKMLDSFQPDHSSDDDADSETTAVSKVEG